MRHYGDITKLNGAELPVVDIICGGSPCQDLSVAGKREGLAGARSGLFMEQIRVIKEMREHDKANRGANEYIRPRYMVWENVTGALSSGKNYKGEDFRIVLEETAKIADETATIPRPPAGGWSTSGMVIGNSWSLCWRLHDSQWWGVPQRRKRVALVADFDGYTAGEILFDLRRETNGSDRNETIGNIGAITRPEIQPITDRLYGNNQQSGAERQGTPGDVEGCADKTSYTLKIRGGVEVDSKGKKAGKGALVQTELSATLGVSQDQTLITIGHDERSAQFTDDEITDPLTASDYKMPIRVAYRKSDYGNYREDTTLATLKNSGGDYGGGSESLIVRGKE